MQTRRAPRLLLPLLLTPVLLVPAAPTPGHAAPACASDDAGLELPEGLCAIDFASRTGPVRNLAVADDGVVYAALRGDDDSGGALALRDGDGDGRADERVRFGSGDAHGIALTPTHLYLATADRVVRWPRAKDELAPSAPLEVIVSGFPEQRSHRVKAIALGPDDALFVEVGAPSNACQQKTRSKGSPGVDPCPQRRLQAGIWRYSASERDQRHTAEARFATGLRHALGLAVDPGTGQLWGAVNGRDQLGSLWGYDTERNAALPAEELVAIDAGDDFGWPYCYHDGLAGRKVLAPEYGGDGSERGRCRQAEPPALAFPAHWAPMAIHFYRGGERGGDQGGGAGDGVESAAHRLPERYAAGALVAFRGSWNRAPLPQEGYRVAFAPFADGRPSGDFETFAIGAESPTAVRMTGIGEGPDGALYLAADANERIWRIQPSGAGRDAEEDAR